MDELLYHSDIKVTQKASTIKVIDLAGEYAKLASLLTLSEQQEIRLQEILALAVEDEVLNFWITEIDHIISHKLGVLNNDSIQDYQNQQALLREHLGDVIAKNPTITKVEASDFNFPQVINSK